MSSTPVHNYDPHLGGCRHPACAGPVAGYQCADCGHYYPRSRVTFGADSEPRCRQGMGCDAYTPRVPRKAAEYFGISQDPPGRDHPVIGAVFTTAGWADDPARPLVTYRRVVALRGAGVTSVALDWHGRRADFTVAELAGRMGALDAEFADAPADLSRARR